MKLNIRKFQKGGSSKLPTFSLPEINIYPQNRFGDIARKQGLETARNWRKVREGQLQELMNLLMTQEHSLFKPYYPYLKD